MSARRTSERDRRRRAFGQNFLVDERLIRRFVASLELRPGELVVDLGAGAGALTRPLLDAGAHVWAVERDSRLAARLRHLDHRPLPGRLRVIETDLRNLRLPRVRHRVVANPPFGLTTDLLALLLDRPEAGPTLADLVVQREVAVKFARRPASHLRGAAWAPWWEFELGVVIPRDAFRPRPDVDAAVLTVRRRTDDVLPSWLAPRFRELLRSEWNR